MAVSDASGAILFRFVYDTYGELSDIKTDNGISLKTSEQLAEYSLAELADAIGIDYLYNGQYGVEIDRNGLYYMRARYYDQDIKRFINRDVVSGDITNSQSLNRYCYVQGNPVSLTDPFGLCPTPEEMEWNRFKKKVSNITHNALDGLGLVFDPADILNAFLYLIEDEYEMAALSVICMFPIVGSIFGLGAKLTMKITDAIGPNVFKQVQKHWDDIVEAGKKLGKATSEKLQKAGKWITEKVQKLFKKKITFTINGKEFVLDNASDVWKLDPTTRGVATEKILADTEYADWFNCGQLDNGYFPVVDFQRGMDVVSLKTIDPTLPSYQNGKGTKKVLDYIDALNRKITIDGEDANKILDIRVPQGTKGDLNIKAIEDYATQRNITVMIKEF